ncbi:MAG TPA: isocitrate lyase/phosphoenolpyruvate mutase family protein [Burkholderiales bacterium]|nr:isocitrate lyase/phosphoenolpyruvate mutase family protein [Burkholderiales bacterium]
MDKQTTKGEKFLRAHREPGIVVLPNAWDAGSAVMMADAGFAFIATTSAGIAFTMGLPDGQRVSRERMLEKVAEIAAAVDVPVSADLEAGYGDEPEAVAQTVRGALAAGAVGCNIEDATGRKDKPLYDFDLACERIRAGAEAARASGKPFVLNARTDPYLVRRGADAENFAEAVRRANAFREAGADCLFVPGSLDASTIERLAKEIDGPLNVLGARGGSASTLGVADLQRLGVRRISIGGSLCVATLGFAQQALRELAGHGRFGYAAGAPSNAAINALMEKHER